MFPWALRNVGDIVAGENHGGFGGARAGAVRRDCPGSSAHVGGAAVLDAEVRGSERLFGQWLHDGAPVLKCHQPAVVVAQLQPTNAGDYVFVVSNAVSTSSSAPVALAVLATPEIATEPRQLNHPPALPLYTLAAVAYGGAAFALPMAVQRVRIYLKQFISGTQNRGVGDQRHNLRRQWRLPVWW